MSVLACVKRRLRWLQHTPSLVAKCVLASAVALASSCGASTPSATASQSQFAPHETTPPHTEVRAFAYTVGDLELVSSFFRDALGADLGPIVEVQPIASAPGATGTQARSQTLRLGAERLLLTEYEPAGEPVPTDSRSNDLWFEHLAIVVSDMDEAHRRVVRFFRLGGAGPISVGGPQTLPESNEAAAGVRAFYFRDPEGHPLELIWYPESKGDARWHSSDALMLGIDHSAIGVSDSRASHAFYEALGLSFAGGSLNEGTEQEALSGVAGARVEISGYRGAAGPGVEFLRYLAPLDGRGAPRDESVNDLWHWEIVVQLRDPAPVIARARATERLWADSADGPWLLRDPDGHIVRVER